MIIKHPGDFGRVSRFMSSSSSVLVGIDHIRSTATSRHGTRTMNPHFNDLGGRIQILLCLSCIKVNTCIIT